MILNCKEASLILKLMGQNREALQRRINTEYKKGNALCYSRETHVELLDKISHFTCIDNNPECDHCYKVKRAIKNLSGDKMLG